MSAPPERLSPEEQDRRYLHLVPEIEAVFKAGYDNTILEHHVWEHGLDVYNRDAAFREELLELGVPNVPGEFMTHIKGKGHDFRYKKFFDLKASGKNPYDCAERLTIVEGSDQLRAFEIDESTIEEWGEHIWGTKLGVRCNELGSFTLCAADMANTGEDYDTAMKPATARLLLEKQRLEDPTVDPASFAIGSLVVVARYHFENLNISQHIDKSPSIRALHEQRYANLSLLAKDAAGMVGKVGEDAVRDFLEKLGGPVARILPFVNQKAS